jgi:hypothetical protein
MKRIILIVLIGLISACSDGGAGNEYRSVDKKLYMQWKEKPKASEIFEKSLLPQVTKIGDETKKCYEGLKKRVTLIVEINGIGENSGAWTDRSSEVTNCMRDIAKNVKYPNPPFEPFYMKIILNVQQWPLENG